MRNVETEIVFFFFLFKCRAKLKINPLQIKVKLSAKHTDCKAYWILIRYNYLFVLLHGHHSDFFIPSLLCYRVYRAEQNSTSVVLGKSQLVLPLNIIILICEKANLFYCCWISLIFIHRFSTVELSTGLESSFFRGPLVFPWPSW